MMTKKEIIRNRITELESFKKTNLLLADKAESEQAVQEFQNNIASIDIRLSELRSLYKEMFNESF